MVWGWMLVFTCRREVGDDYIEASLEAESCICGETTREVLGSGREHPPPPSYIKQWRSGGTEELVLSVTQSKVHLVMKKRRVCIDIDSHKEHL